MDRMITYYAQDQLSDVGRVQHVREFLESLQNSGHLALDPNASCYSRDIWALYLSQPYHPLSRNMFGRCLTALGSPVLRGTAGYAKRGGIRLPEAPGCAASPDAS